MSVRQRFESESRIGAALFLLPGIFRRYPRPPAAAPWRCMESLPPNIRQAIFCDWPRPTFFTEGDMAVRVEVPTFGTEPVRFETLAALRRRGVFPSVISHPVRADAAGTAIAIEM